MPDELLEVLALLVLEEVLLEVEVATLVELEVDVELDERLVLTTLLAWLLALPTIP